LISTSCADEYKTPQIRKLGTLHQTTATVLGGAIHFNQAPIGSVPGGGGGGGGSPGAPVAPGPGPGNEVMEEFETGGVPREQSGSPNSDSGSGPGNSTNQVFGSNDSGGSTPAQSPAGDGVRAGPGEEGGGGNLPFTGLAVGPLATLGAALTAAGAALRRALRKH